MSRRALDELQRRQSTNRLRRLLQDNDENRNRQALDENVDQLQNIVHNHQPLFQEAVLAEHHINVEDEHGQAIILEDEHYRPEPPFMHEIAEQVERLRNVDQFFEEEDVQLIDFNGDENLDGLQDDSDTEQSDTEINHVPPPRDDNNFERLELEDDDDLQPLYDGASITIAESMLLLLNLFLRHNITAACLADIITIINLHCLQQGLKKNSLHKFKNYFALGVSTIRKHFYCTTCTRELRSVIDVCPSCPVKPNSYFVQLPFFNQLKEMYKRQDFYNMLQSRLQRRVPSDIICDIYDGAVYKEWINNGFLLNPNNISFSWYTDGIPIFKSSKVSAWPLYLTINELPFEERKKRENTLLLGLWYGNHKPDMNRFLFTFRSDLEQIARNGLLISTFTNNTINVRGIILMGTCDLPAKSQCLNFKQFNGEYGCCSCLCKGEPFQIGPRSHVHTFPYPDQIVMRTKENSIEFADRSTINQSVMGVKGHSALSKLMPDFIKGMAIDRMHGVDGGIVKKLLTLWFDSDYSQCNFSLHAVKNIVNTRLQSIKPPKFVHRMPRTVEDLLHWKSSELKLWFFYYSIPVISDIMRNDFFENYLCLVVGIYLLNSDITSQPRLLISENFLHKFVRQFQDLYGREHCTINVHQLLHLPYCVYNLGPLWTNSCYEYENINGQIVQLVHGTSHIDTQVATSHNEFIKLPRFSERLTNEEIKNFCTKKKHQVKLIESLFENCYSVGSYKYLAELPNDINSILNNMNFDSQNITVWQYLRLLKNKKLYISEKYSRSLQTKYSIVKYFDSDNFENFGMIDCFLKINMCNCLFPRCGCESRHYAILKEVNTHTVLVARGDNCIYNTSEFLRRCITADNVKAVPIETLACVCVYMNIDDNEYVGIPVNEKELE